MNFSAPFIARPIGTVLLAAGVFLAGVVAYRQMPVSSLPNIDIPTIAVAAKRPGADPITMAATVAAPLERRLGEIAGVTEITSSSSLGSTTIVVQFDINRNIDGAARDVQAAINAAITDLPTDLSSPPVYHKANPAATPLMVLALTSDTLTPSAVYDVADTLVSQRIAQVEGVAQADVNGAQQPAIRLDMDPNRLAAMGISLTSVKTALSNASTMTALGALDGENTTSTLSTGGQLLSPDDYGSITLRAANGTVVHLRDVGRVTQGVVNDRARGWIGQRLGVNIAIFKQLDANVVDTADRVRALLPNLREWVPAGVKIDILIDRTQSIRGSFADLQRAMLISLVLVMMVVLVFLRRLTATLAAGVAIPLSLAGTITAMGLLHFSLDTLSLMALTVSIGFVVDDAIVMIENAYRAMEQGVPPRQAALQGARQIGFTVISISLSLVAAFVPLLLMGGVLGRLFHEFSVTLVLAIAVSAVVSLTVTPMMCGRFSPPQPAPSVGVWKWIEAGLNGLERGYARSLGWTLKRPSLMIGVFFASLAATVALFMAAPKGFFPTEDTGIVFAVFQASPDVSFETMSALQLRASEIILADPAVEGMASFIGAGASNQGRGFISLKPFEQRQEGFVPILARLRPQLNALTGMNSFLVAAGDVRVGGRMGNGAYQYTLWDSDVDELLRWVPQVAEQAKRLPGLQDVSTDRDQGGMQTSVVVDRTKAARLGVSMTAVDSALGAAFAQQQALLIYGDRNQYRVVLTVPPRFRRDPTALEHVYVPGSNGATVPLASLARLEATQTPLAINHQGQYPAVTITYNLDAAVSVGQSITALEAMLADLHPPASLHAGTAGNASVFMQGLNSEPLLIGGALLAIYIVLGVLYENLIHPLTILSTLPSAGVGALVAMRVTGTELNLLALLGIILLIGIVKKNGIMMVDFALEAERIHGMTAHEAIFHASVVRFRPILMTSLAAALGALPLALSSGAGAELRQPLGVTIFGGMVVSQFITIYTTPSLYLALDRLAHKFSRRRKPLGNNIGQNPAL